MFKKIFPVAAVALMLAACTDDYTDWQTPDQNAAVATIEGTMTATAAQTDLIDLAKAGESVKLLNIQAPAGATVESYCVTLKNAEGKTYDLHTADGTVPAEDLNNAVIYLFNREVVERTVTATVKADALVKGQEGEATVHYEVASPLTFKLQCIPATYTEYLWAPGEGNGWNHGAAERLYSPDQDGHYTGFVYVGGKFKFTPASDWAHGDYGGTLDHLVTGGGDIEAGANGVYYFNVDLTVGSATATPVSFGIVGNAIGSWDNDVMMEYDAAAGCWVAELDMTADTFKFRANHGWEINFGGSFDNLTAGGPDMSIAEAGTYVVRLYTGRVGGKNIYCEVEKQ